MYRARDTKLSRDIALKVLHELVAENRDRLSRFTREAQLLASLNHPNIAAIYGVEEASGGLALVLEYVDGETLADRINRGPIPLAETLRISLQISQALESAHEKGIIHRDLKPANVKITSDGTVKVLDFGLAKALQDESSNSSPSLSQSPTVSLGATNAGTILGTAGYMSPEQARGKPVDRRTDIWAFGVVLYEMLSARRVFEGETMTDTLVNLLERDPDWNQLPSRTPVSLRKLLQRCLTKNPKDRLQAIGDARTQLEELLANPVEQSNVVEPARYPSWKKVLPWALVPVALAAGFFLRPPEKPNTPVVSQFEYPLPPNHFLAHASRTALDVSPDGRKLAFIGFAPNTTQTPRRIFVRNLDRWDTVAVPGTENAVSVFFSPDGQSIGFQQGRQIKKVSIAGGAPTIVVERLDNQGNEWGPPSITWGKNGNIVFSHSLGAGLSVVRDTGGEPEQLTTLDEKTHESSHRLPHFLPDGNAVLFTTLKYTTITPDWKLAQVWVKPLNGDRKLLLDNAMDARYAGNGTLIFARQAKLFAVHFDPATLSVSGNPVQVLDGVNHALYGSTGTAWTGAAQYSVSENGTLFYAPGSIEPPLLTALNWVDRTGKVTPITGPRPMFRFAARVLPDGKRVAFSEVHLNKDIWVFDSTRGTEDRVTFEGQNAFPIWSPDSSKMAFRSDRSGPLGIYIAQATNPREVVQLTPGPQDVPSSWTADGKELAFTRGFSATGGNTDIYVASVDRPMEARPLIATNANENFPEFSPDGKWLAYISNESGRATLYVQPYPGPGMRVTVTGQGPTEPAWSKNSSELFYRSGAQILSVRYRVSGAEFIPEKPVVLFSQPPVIGGTTVRASYDVASDGRFLLNQASPEGVADRNARIYPSALRLILNWNVETARLLAGR